MSRRFKYFLIVIFVGVCSSCVRYGPKIDDQVNFFGAESRVKIKTKVSESVLAPCVTVDYSNQQQTKLPEIKGELLALQDDGYLVVCRKSQYDMKVALIDYSVISRAFFYTPSGEFSLIGNPLDKNRTPQTTIEKLTLWSRFPQGVSESLLKNLLRAYNQKELISIQ